MTKTRFTNRFVRVYDKAINDYRTVSVSIEIDMQRLAQEMGPKAYANKSKQACEVHNSIRVTVLGTQQL